MLVKATEMCFINGSRRKPGAVFEYHGKPCSFLVEVPDGSAPVEPPAPQMDDAALRVRLAEYGVKVSPKASREQMDVLLAEAEGK